MAVLLALLAAAGWGSSDYAAGVASRRSSALAVVVLAHLVSATGLLLAVLLSVPHQAWAGFAAAAHLVTGPTGPSGPDAAQHLVLDVTVPVGALHLAPAADLAWGAAGGISGGLGAVLLFRGLARGRVSVVAPITAVVAAVLPVVGGLLWGESLGPLGGAAVLLALVAVTMISDSPDSADSVDSADHGESGEPGPADGAPLTRRALREQRAREGRRSRREQRDRRSRSLLARFREPGIVEALGSGVGFGLFYVLIGHTGADAGLWPVLAARVASVLLFASFARVAREQLLPQRPDRRAVITAGVLDAVAATAFLIATRHGMLAVVAVITSLYPAATIGLARLLDREHCSRRQVVGLGLAAVCVGVLAVV